MCIEVLKKRFYITKKTKRCYKVLLEYHKKLYPPYFYEKTSYKFNLKYSIPEGEFEETIEDPISLYHSSNKAITTVGFYSFNNIDGARELKNKLENNIFYHNRVHFVIVECEIPEDTKYLSGHEHILEKSYQSYCSQSIIIRNIIE